jgi:hypothetical protein
MSMHKTCPISNFTSGEDSVGTRFHSTCAIKLKRVEALVIEKIPTTLIATPVDGCFDILRTRNESASQFYRLRNLSALRFGCSDTLLEQLNNHLPQLLLLVNRTNLHFAHQFVGEIERCLRERRFPEIWFSVNCPASITRFSSSPGLCQDPALMSNTRIVRNSAQCACL